jgi:MFS family permease
VTRLQNTLRLPRFEGWYLRILIATVLINIVIQAARPMATYKALALNGSVGDIGFVAASFGLLSLFFAVPIGRWVDRGNEPRFVVAGAALMAVAAAMTPAVTSILALAFTQGLIGLGQVCLAVGVQTMIANHGGQEDRDRRFGAFAVAQSLGQLIGPAGAGLLAANPGGPPNTDIAFTAAAIAAVIAALVSLTFLFDADRGRSGDREARVEEPLRQAFRRVLAVPSMAQAMLAGVAVVVSVNVLIAYLPAYGEAEGISVQVVGGLLALRAGASMASRLLMGAMRRRLGRRNLLLACMAGPAIALFAVSLDSNFAILVIAMIITGYGLGLGQPLTLSWIAGQAPRDLRGTAVAVRMAGNRLGQFAIPATLGILAGFVGVTGVFWSLGIFLAITAALVRTGPFIERVE